jgi:phage gp45-like
MHLPTANLPWAKPLLPVNGTDVFAPKEGDMVIGFFIDGENAQERVMMGILPNIPLKAANPQQAFADPRTATELKSAPRTPNTKTYNTNGTGIVITERELANSYPKILDEPSTSRIARNDANTITKTFIQERKDNCVKNVPTANSNSTWDEPETKYGTVYPYNNVKETESGHILEFDDTPEKERIHLAHRNGSFQEWFPDGDKVEKITKNNYEIIMGNDSVYIMGSCNVTVQGSAQVYVKKDALLKIDGNVQVAVGGNYTETVGGTYTVNSGGNMKFVAPRIDLNP